jgi:pimeloyl-ACP methyl ester carboxylesterase
VQAQIAHLATRSVRYLEAGSGDPLLLLHAFPLNAEQWLPQLDRPPQGWRLIAPDLTGFGPAGPIDTGAGMTMDRYAADVVELLDHLAARLVTVCGLSLGGYVALALLRVAPTRVRSIVLADTRADADSPEARANRDRLRARLERDGPGSVVDAMLPGLLGQTTRREQPDLADAVRHIAMATAPAGIGAAIEAMGNRPDSRPLLPAIGQPTLVICGEEDTLTPLADAERLRDGISGARLHVVPRAGHLSNLEQPLAFTAALTAQTSYLQPPVEGGA